MSLKQCLVSFGANLGPRDRSIVSAVRALSARPEVQHFRVSRLYETPPIGGPSGQSSFLNGVAVFDTCSRAREVLAWLQEIEQQLGRQRQQRWAARSIDLDVVLYGSLVGGANDLTVPHPRYTARRFVLQPACDIAPDYCDPRFGWTIRQLADHLDQGNPSFSLAGGDEATRAELCRILQVERGIRTFQAAPLPEPMAVVGTAPLAQPIDSIPQTTIEVSDGAPWVSAFVPALPQPGAAAASAPSTPRLIARIQYTQPEQRWPAPHRMWPSGLNWPEYRLEFDDLAWAAGEIASALDSMRCPLVPVSDDGSWWR